MKALTYVEIDLDYCSLTYGVGACTAAIPTTGPRKCMNTLKTCQVRTKFVNAPITLRFAEPADYLPRDIEAIPSINGVSFTPGTVSLGEDLGQRATLSVSFGDHRWSDTGPGFDKYLAERGYDAFERGTFWGKFRARHPYLRGRAIRLIRGVVGQALADMEVRHYILESFTGPTPDGIYTLTAKDVLKLADGDRAQAPKLSNGFLVSAITAAATTATLSPSGVGNAEYPASGYVAIGGKEICGFTRSADTLTLTRAQYGTTAVAHDGQDRAQLVLRYVAQDPANIIADLLHTYAEVPAQFIPIAAWLTETQAFNRRLYTGVIAEPTSVNDLCSELIEQAALAVWWSDTQQQIRLQVLRSIPTDAQLFDADTILQGTLSVQEQPAKRISQVWTYFGQRNPLQSVDEPDNYRSTALTIDLQAQTDYGAPAIKKIFSRWIPAFGRTVALRLNNIQLGRFRDPPRKLGFSLFRAPGDQTVRQGGGYRVGSQAFQDETGALVTVPIQVTRLNPDVDKFSIEAEEMLFVNFDNDDLSQRVLIIDGDATNLNLRTIHDTLYPSPVSGDNLICVIESGVKVGSANVGFPAIEVGSWPSGVDITLKVRGRIQGTGGKGGRWPNTGALAPEKGGTALFTRYPIKIEFGGGEIFAGGGGGVGVGTASVPGYATGGGGRGYVGGSYIEMTAQGGERTFTQPTTGTPEAPGLGGVSIKTGSFVNWNLRGGDGGEAGQRGQGGDAGAAGNAIDGISYVTFTAGAGDRRGLEIN